MLNFKQIRRLALHREALPCSICGSHVLNVVFSLSDADGGVHVTQMLVVLEVNEVVRLSSNGHFSFVGYLNTCSVSWPFNDSECHYSSCKASLKLVASHFDDHILHTT